MISLKPHSDESLHGFIFRMIYVNGLTDYQYVLKKRGWALFPTVPAELDYLFDQIPLKQLTDLTSRSVSTGIKGSSFPATWMFEKSFKAIFRGQDRLGKSQACLAIRWCEECIAQQIHVYGFGYYRASWLHETYCGYHQKHLLELHFGERGVSSTKVAMSVIQILSAKTTDNFPIIKAGENPNLKSIPIEKQDLTLSVCAQNLFGFIFARGNKAKEKVSFVCAFNKIKRFPEGAGNEGSSFNFNQRVFRNVQERYGVWQQAYFESLEDFFFPLLDLTGAWISLGNRVSASVTILKDMNQNCSRCLEVECPASRTIARLATS